MNGTYATKKYAADKIALLALFIIAVLIAYSLTLSRSHVYLSEPIKLDCARLSVSIPAGNGWRSEKQWNYQENGFTLTSIFTPHKGSEATLVHCRYPLADEPNIQFEKKALQIAGSIAKSGKTKTGKLVFQWAHLENKNILFDTFLGIAWLPNSRRLDIEVRQVAGDSRLAERLFKRVIDSVKAEDNELLAAGSEIVTQIKNKGIDTFLNSHPRLRGDEFTPARDPAPGRRRASLREPKAGAESSQRTAPLKTQTREDFFLIKDPLKHPLGFVMETLISSEQDNSSNIQAAGFHYLTDTFATEQITFFQSDNSFNEFISKSKTIGIKGTSSSQTVLNKAGLMTIRQFSPRDEEKYYYPGPAAIPDVFLEQLFSQMLDSNHKKVFIDIIEADGKITPISVSKINAEDVTGKVSAAYILKVKLLDGRGFYEMVYLDNKKRISKRLLHQNGDVYTLERSSKENILKQFPERAGYILQKNKMLEQNQPPD